MEDTMGYVDWLREQLPLIDPEGDRAVLYEPGRGYFVEARSGPLNGDGAARAADVVLELDQAKRTEILLDEVAGYAARGRKWRGRDECPRDHWDSQVAHFRKTVTRLVARATAQHKVGLRERQLRAAVHPREVTRNQGDNAAAVDAHSAA
jgi:hypothetical protein